MRRVSLALCAPLVIFALEALAAAEATPCGGVFNRKANGPPPAKLVKGWLSTAVPRPGPDILYWPLAHSPQLENTGPWQAAPILVSGASAY